MNSNIIYAGLFLLIGITIGYSLDLPQEQLRNEVEIPETVSSLGSSDMENTTEYSYELTLYNPGDKIIHVNTVEPVFNSEFLKRVYDEELTLYVDEDLGPGATKNVGAQLQVNTTLLSKEDIDALSPFLQGAKVSTSREISFRDF